VLDRHWGDRPEREVQSVSIVRIGLGETEGFGDGYEAIFGKKKQTTEGTKEPSAAKAAESKETKPADTKPAKKK